MNLKKIVSITSILLFLTLFLSINTVSADDEVRDNIEADFYIEFKSATDFKINIVVDINQIYLPANGRLYTNDQIKSNINSETMGAIKGQLKGLLTTQINKVFKNASIDIINEFPSYRNYKFYDEYDVNLTSGFFDINKTADANEFINGMLDMNAIVNYTFDLQAEPGWNNSYIFDLGDLYNFDFVNTGILGVKTVEWRVFNYDGETQYKQALLNIFKINPTTKNLVSDDISLGFNLDSYEVENTSLSTDVWIKNANVKKYNVLPSFIDRLKYLPSDGFRLLVNNGFLTWDDIYQKTVLPVEKDINNILKNSSFNQSLDFVLKWDNKTTFNSANPYNINNMNNDPIIKAELSDDTIDFEICNISNRAFFGLINSGAKSNISKNDINFGDDLNKFKLLGYEYNATLFLPPKMYLNGSNVYWWNDTTYVSGEFTSDNSISYDKEIKETLIEIEIKDTDLNLLSFISGSTELNLEMDIEEKRKYNVSNITDIIDIPDKISISFLNSDGIRLLAEEDIFNEELQSAFLKNEKKLFETRLNNILSSLKISGSGNVKKNVFKDSLQNWDRNISKMDADTAIKIDNYVNCLHAVKCDISFLPPSFNIRKQSLNLTGIKDHNVTYRVVFPKGIKIKVNDPLKKINVKTKGDGRKYFEVSFNSSEYNLTDEISVEMQTSALYVIGLLSPCIITIVITLILIITILIIRKKRKGFKRSEPVEEENSSYEEEDYYIPPPPES